jgi:hypothetical protein
MWLIHVGLIRVILGVGMGQVVGASGGVGRPSVGAVGGVGTRAERVVVLGDLRSQASGGVRTSAPSGGVSTRLNP